MQCTAFCTAKAFDTQALLAAFPKHSRFYREVLHLKIPHEDSQEELFIFPYGVLVAWNIENKNEEKRILETVKPFQKDTLEHIDIDRFSFSYGHHAKILKDHIFLPDHETLTKLAFSHGLAQSVKLSTFESQIQRTFLLTQKIPEALATQGRTTLSRREIRKMMGKLFLERSSVNLHLDVLDVPEFFWDAPELEPYYTLAANYLDVKTRVQILNQRLDVVHELFEMLNNELHHQHSSMLEWTIIALILIEVGLTVLKDVIGVL